MSLYGLERRTNFSPFQFDKIYSSRKAMDEAMNPRKSDGIYVGRYILISYGEDDFIRQENTDSSEENANDFITAPGADLSYDNEQNSITISQQNLNIEEIVATKSNPEFQANLKLDLETYGNSYHNTVWMKVYRNAQEEYIMIAELNARAPQLGIEAVDPAIKLYTDANAGIVTSNTKEEWQEPYFDLSKSSDLYYTLKMPKTHEYKVGEIDYAAVGFDPEQLDKDLAITENSTNPPLKLKADFNTINWQYLNTDGTVSEENDGIAIGKQLNMNLPAFGQLASILYDLLYGVPENPEQGGPRPHYNIDISNILGPGQNTSLQGEGILYLISQIFQNGGFHVNWLSDSIDNKPKVIGVEFSNCDIELLLDNSDNNKIVLQLKGD